MLMNSFINEITPEEEAHRQQLPNVKTRSSQIKPGNRSIGPLDLPGHLMEQFQGEQGKEPASALRSKCQVKIGKG